MTTTHYSDTVVKAEAMKAAKRKTRKYTAVGAILAVAVVPTAAYAYMSGIFGSGNVSGEAYEATMTVSSSTAGQMKLYPGANIDVQFKVNNPNPFPIEVTQVQATSFSSTDCGSNLAWFSGPVSALNKPITLAAPVRVAANGNSNVSIPQGIKLSETATKGCGFAMGLKVTGNQVAQTAP
jgi:hypothetical protein